MNQTNQEQSSSLHDGKFSLYAGAVIVPADSSQWDRWNSEHSALEIDDKKSASTTTTTTTKFSLDNSRLELNWGQIERKVKELQPVIEYLISRCSNCKSGERQASNKPWMGSICTNCFWILAGSREWRGDEGEPILDADWHKKHMNKFFGNNKEKKEAKEERDPKKPRRSYRPKKKEEEKAAQAEEQKHWEFSEGCEGNRSWNAVDIWAQQQQQQDRDADKTVVMAEKEKYEQEALTDYAEYKQILSSVVADSNTLFHQTSKQTTGLGSIFERTRLRFQERRKQSDRIRQEEQSRLVQEIQELQEAHKSGTNPLLTRDCETVNGYQLHNMYLNHGLPSSEYDKLVALSTSEKKWTYDDWETVMSSLCCTDWNKMDVRGVPFGTIHWENEHPDAGQLTFKDNCKAMWDLPFTKDLLLETIRMGCRTRQECVRYSNSVCVWLGRRIQHDKDKKKSEKDEVVTVEHTGTHTFHGETARRIYEELQRAKEEGKNGIELKFSLTPYRNVDGSRRGDRVGQTIDLLRSRKYAQELASEIERGQGSICDFLRIAERVRTLSERLGLEPIPSDARLLTDGSQSV